jgi:hypothetical protein
MKNKAELIAALTAKGVACDESMTVAALQELATKNSIDLKKEKPPTEIGGAGNGGGGPTEVPAGKPPVAPPAALANDDVEWRVKAGLSREQAMEVAARQREEDTRK